MIHRFKVEPRFVGSRLRRCYSGFQFSSALPSVPPLAPALLDPRTLRQPNPTRQEPVPPFLSLLSLSSSVLLFLPSFSSSLQHSPSLSLSPPPSPSLPRSSLRCSRAVLASGCCRTSLYNCRYYCCSWNEESAGGRERRERGERRERERDG